MARTPEDVLQIVEDIEGQAERLARLVEQGRGLGVAPDRLAEWEAHRAALERTARTMRAEVESAPAGSDYYAMPDFDAAVAKLSAFNAHLEEQEAELNAVELSGVLERVLPRGMLEALRALAGGSGEPHSDLIGKAAQAWVAAGKPPVEIPPVVKTACAELLDEKRASEARWCYQAIAWWLAQQGAGSLDERTGRQPN